MYFCGADHCQHSLLSLSSLLETIPDCLSSLRRLHYRDCGAVPSKLDDEAQLRLTFSSLSRLQGLTHCRFEFDNLKPSALTCSSLVSALSSLQSLTFLDLGTDTHIWPHVLRLLCSDAATPLLLRLQTLVLSRLDLRHGMDALYNVFLCRLSSLPASPALQRFHAVRATHRAAGLLSVFSLPHLTQLDLGGSVQRSEFCAFASSFTSASAPLVSLVFPNIVGEAHDRRRDKAAVAKDAAAVSRAARLLLSRFPALRELHCDNDMLSGVVALRGSLPGSTTSGCSASLYRLAVVDRVGPSPFPFAAPPSFPQLTELILNLPLMDAELEELLSNCPQLLVLRLRGVSELAGRHHRRTLLSPTAGAGCLCQTQRR